MHHIRNINPVLTPTCKMFIIIILKVIQPSAQLTIRSHNNLLRWIALHHPPSSESSHLQTLHLHGLFWVCPLQNFSMHKVFQARNHNSILEMDDFVIADIYSMMLEENRMLQHYKHMISSFQVIKIEFKSFMKALPLVPIDDQIRSRLISQELVENKNFPNLSMIVHAIFMLFFLVIYLLFLCK